MMEAEDIGIERIAAGFLEWDDLLALILSAFEYMAPLIDPPSSALRLTPGALRQKAGEEVAFGAYEGQRLVGCVFCKAEPDCLYVGKLAVRPDRHGRGIGRRLLAEVEAYARASGFEALRLQTRVQLTANRRTFEAWGFVATGQSSHAGFDRPTTIEMRKSLLADGAPAVVSTEVAGANGI